MKILPLIFVLCVGCAANADDSQTKITALAQELVGHTARLSVPNEPSSADLGGARMSADQKVTEWSVEGVVTLLGTSDQEDFLELLWWKHPNRAVRLLIVASFMCRSIEPTTAVPPFDAYATQFKDDEARNRLEEVTFVQAHLSAFADQLVKLTGSGARLKDLREQYASVARKKIGSELPKR